MLEGQVKEGQVVVIGFVNGASIIGRLFVDEKGNPQMRDVFTINLARNPESKERSFIFKPVLPFASEQMFSANTVISLAQSESVLSIYNPTSNVESAYLEFIQNKDLVKKVIECHQCECPPSKEFVDKILQAEKVRKNAIVENGVIKGLFGPELLSTVIDDEEGQG